MCVLLYAAVIMLFGLYSYDLLNEYALSVSAEGGTWTVVALGPEMLLILWPALIAVAAVSSALTYFTMRRQGHAPPLGEVSPGD